MKTRSKVIAVLSQKTLAVVNTKRRCVVVEFMPPH